MRSRLMCLVSLVLVALTIVSCRRDHLYYASSGTATVLVEPDWSLSGVHPNGVTVFAYNNSDGLLYKRFPPVSVGEKCYVKLPQGDYTLLVMNDTPEEFAGKIAFTGSESLSTFRAMGVKDEQRSIKLSEHLASRAEGEPELYCIVEPDTLVVSVIRGLHISQEMLDYYYDRPDENTSIESVTEVKTAPTSVVSTVNIKAHVKGLKYARGTTLSFLRGVAAGHCLGLEENTREQAAHAFVLNNRVFDEGSDSDGTIKAQFLSFGLQGDGKTDSRYYLDINFVLVNGENHPMTFDVTDLISVDVSLSLHLSLNLDLEIELPEVGETEDGGGFNADVIEWDDETVDIPM